MNIRRIITLEATLLCGLGSVFLLPKNFEIQPAAIAMSLPTFVGDWYGTGSTGLTEAERCSGTGHSVCAQAVYKRTRGPNLVSIASSGPDMATSIHGPERCLPSQGWAVVDSAVTKVPIGKENFATTRLLNLRNFHNGNAPAR